MDYTKKKRIELDPKDQPDPPQNKLYIGNLPLNMAKDVLAAHIRPCGRIREIITFDSKNYAFVHMVSVAEAKRVITDLNGEMIRGHTIQVQHAVNARRSHVQVYTENRPAFNGRVSGLDDFNEYPLPSSSFQKGTKQNFIKRGQSKSPPTSHSPTLSKGSTASTVSIPDMSCHSSPTSDSRLSPPMSLFSPPLEDYQKKDEDDICPSCKNQYNGNNYRKKKIICGHYICSTCLNLRKNIDKKCVYNCVESDVKEIPEDLRISPTMANGRYDSRGTFPSNDSSFIGQRNTNNHLGGFNIASTNGASSSSNNLNGAINSSDQLIRRSTAVSQALPFKTEPLPFSNHQSSYTPTTSYQSNQLSTDLLFPRLGTPNQSPSHTQNSLLRSQNNSLQVNGFLDNSLRNNMISQNSDLLPNQSLGSFSSIVTSSNGTTNATSRRTGYDLDIHGQSRSPLHSTLLDESNMSLIEQKTINSMQNMSLFNLSSPEQTSTNQSFQLQNHSSPSPPIVGTSAPRQLSEYLVQNEASRPSPVSHSPSLYSDAGLNEKDKICSSCLTYPLNISCIQKNHLLVDSDIASALIAPTVREKIDQVLLDLRTAMSHKASQKERLQFSLHSLNKFTQELTRKLEYEDYQEQHLQRLLETTSDFKYSSTPHNKFSTITDLYAKLHQIAQVVSAEHDAQLITKLINDAAETVTVKLQPTYAKLYNSLGLKLQEEFNIAASLEDQAKSGNFASVILNYITGDLLKERMKNKVPFYGAEHAIPTPSNHYAAVDINNEVLETTKAIENGSLANETIERESNSLGLENISIRNLQGPVSNGGLSPEFPPSNDEGNNNNTNTNDNEEDNNDNDKKPVNDEESSIISYRDIAKRPAKPQPPPSPKTDVGLNSEMSEKGRLPLCWMVVSINGVKQEKIIFQLRIDKAPIMCRNFMGLCKGEPGYGYVGSHFFMAGEGFLAGGDVQYDDGSGGYSIYDRTSVEADLCPLADEVGAIRFKGVGTSASGKGMIGSQFMIWYKEREFKKFNNSLVFGRVSYGMDVVEKISELNLNVDAAKIEECGVAFSNCF